MEDEVPLSPNSPAEGGVPDAMPSSHQWCSAITAALMDMTFNGSARQIWMLRTGLDVSKCRVRDTTILRIPTS